MSSITFNARNHSAVLRGAERHMLGGLCSSVAQMALRRIHASAIVEKGNPAHYIYAAAARVVAAGEDSWSHRKELDRQLDTYANVGDMGGGSDLFPGVDMFGAQLNTVNAMGSPVLRLAARIHGQCEIHLWIAGEHTGNIAGVIELGRGSNIFRPNMGWEAVVEMLRIPDVGDVVLSYSVTDSFPNDHIALSDKLPASGDWTAGYNNMSEEERNAQSTLDVARQEIWYEQMTDDERWDAAMTGLKAKGDGYQLLPDRLHDGLFGFGDGRTLFDLAAGE